MNLQALQYFIAVAQEHSFSKAAQKLYVTQPAISRQIAVLEDQFNVQLLIRDKKSVELSEEGKIFYPIALKITEECKEMERLAEIFQKKKSLTLRIGYPNMMALNFLPDKLRILKEMEPSLGIDLIHTPPFEEALDELRHYRLDAIITSESFVSSKNEFDFCLIQSGVLAAVVSNENPLAEKEKLFFEDLIHEKILIHQLNPDSHASEILYDECFKHGLHEDQIFSMRLTDDIFMNVALNKGVGLMPEVFLDGRKGALRAISLEDCYFSYGAVLLWRKQDKNPAIKSLSKLFEEGR